MRTPRLLYALLPLVTCIPVGCQTVPRGDLTSAQRDVRTLIRWMAGSFSNADQAAGNPDQFSDIRLHTVRIWTDRSDGPWLYMEQAADDTPEQPYRQQVYRLVPLPDGRIESVAHTLPGDPLLFAGWWRRPDRFDVFNPTDLRLRPGCSLVLHRLRDGAFVGSTTGIDCTSNINGASYATSEVTITAAGMIAWDRGFDDKGNQVWGPARGGYMFKRATPIAEDTGP
jgi:hypothetical protein